MTSLKICCAVLVLILGSSTVALAQSQTARDQTAEQAIKALRGREIPEATLPCTSDEAAWWQDLRAGGRAITQSRAAKSERDKFIHLIKTGIEKSYQIPVPNRHPTLLWKAAPDYTEEARNKRINGSVAMAVELRADGTVGEVKIAQSLDPGLDQMAANTVRKFIFLPSVKDRKFVSSWMPMTMTFNIH